MPRDDTQELLNAVTETRRALKGLQRQARATLQLATDLEERLAAREDSLRHPRTAHGGPANASETHFRQPVRAA